MKYIVCQEPGSFALEEKNEPAKKEGQALIKIKKIGICGTDLHAYAGQQAFFTYPRILGHELAAEIIEIDENEHHLKAGDKAIIMPYISCGTCFACQQGKTNCCTNIKVLGVHTDGGMQEVISVPNNLLMPAAGLSWDEMAIVEPLAIGAHAIRRSGLQAGETTVVVGCGPIGIGIMQFAKNAGAMIIAVDVNEERLEYTKQQMGLDYTVNARDNAAQKVAEITNGDLAHVVYDASGNKHALESGIQFMGYGGRYVLVGLSKGELTFKHPEIHAKETTLMCSRNATKQDFDLVIDALKKGLFPTDSFITHRVSFTDMINHFDSWLKPETGVIKAMVDV